MTLVIILVALVVALVIAYNINKKPAKKEEVFVVPDKIEPIAEVKVTEPVVAPAPKKKAVKKTTEKKEVVKKATKKTK